MSRKSQRVVFKSQAREIILKVYDFMKNEASQNYAERLTDARWRTAQAVGISESTVTRILRERKEHSNTIKQNTVPALESNITTEKGEIVAIVPSAERATEPTLEADIDSENEASTSNSNLVDRNASIFTSPMKKRRSVMECPLARINRPCKKTLPAVDIATQSSQTNTNIIQEVNPVRSNIMPMNFHIKLKVENVDENAIEKQHEIISWREIVKKSTEIYLQSNNIFDKILHGQVLNTCKPDAKVFVKTPHEELLDRAFTQWCHWASLTEEPRDPPLFYKCYICDMAWWHLAHFRDHIRTHEPSNLCVALEINDNVECNIVAYYSKSANKFIANIQGKCWKCGENAFEHTKLKNCVGCKKRFPTCSKLRQHQWYCEGFKNMHLDLFASAEQIFKCHLCRFYFFKQEDSINHMMLRHSVRSDVPIPGCAVCEKCKDPISYEDDHVCESKEYVKTCGACNKRVTKSSAAVHEIEWDVTCHVCKVKIVKSCSTHLHALRHTINYGLAYKCLTCKFFIIFDLDQIQKHKMLYHSNRDFEYDLISVPKTIVDRLKSTSTKHDSPVYKQSQINTFLLSHDTQDMVNDRDDDDDDVIIIDNVPEAIVIPPDDAPNYDLPCVIAKIKSEPLENELQTSKTKHTVTPQNDFECKTIVIQVPKDTKDVIKCLSDGNRINDDKELGIDEFKREPNSELNVAMASTLGIIKSHSMTTKKLNKVNNSPLTSRNSESDVKIKVIKSVDVVEKEKLITVDLRDIQLNEQKREEGRPNNLEQITPKESEVSEPLKVEVVERVVEINIPWDDVPIKEESDPEMDLKLSDIRRIYHVDVNVGENEIDVKRELNEFDLTGQSENWHQDNFAYNSQHSSDEFENNLITISPNVTLNTDDVRNQTHRKMGNAIEIEVVADVHHVHQQQSHKTRPYSNAERQRRYRERRKADKMNAFTFSQSSDVQPHHGVQINKRQRQSNAERQRQYRKSLCEQQHKSNTPHTSNIDRLQNVDQAELARKRYLNKQRQSRFRARRKFESPSTSHQGGAIEIEVVADVHHVHQQQSHKTRPYSNAERQRRYRERRKADKMNAFTFSQSSDVQPHHGVQINKRQRQSNAERQRQYRKSLCEQQHKSNTPHTSNIDRLQNVDQAELARKRYLNKQRQSRFRARRRFESPSTSHQGGFVL